VGGGGNALAGWRDKFYKKIFSNITFNIDSYKGNKPAIIEVRLAPDGTILRKVMITSSGDSAYDQAVMTAIDLTQSFPKDDDGKIPELVHKLTFKPK
jgi:colicin import membrane protein